MQKFLCGFRVGFGAIGEESSPKASSAGFPFGPGDFKSTINILLTSS